MEKALEEKIQQLQSIEENLHTYLGQKQQVQAQLMELESAAASLGGATSAFKIIGNLMVEQPAATLGESIKEQTERTNLRLAALERQEEKLKAKAETLQSEVMERMKDGKGK